MEIIDAARLWDPEPGWLNTASYGLPPEPAWTAVRTALGDWRRGLSRTGEWDEAVSRSRAAFARLVGVEADDVSIGGTVSGMLSVVAAALPDGARVVAPDVEFTSNLFPWLVHADRGVEVVTAPPARLAAAIDERTDLVAFSLVQSATGEVAPADEIVAAARAHGALVVADATQACGWLPVDASRFDVLACAAYKWLMAPRGGGFCYTAPALRDRLRPVQAGWYAGEGDAAYGPPLRLAASARRLDTSPAWFSYVGAAPALDLLGEIGVERVHAHAVALADRFRAGLGLPPGDSAIVSVELPGAADRLAAAGVRAAERNGLLRTAFHLYTAEADVDMALDALREIR